METAIILLAICWPPLPDFPTLPEQSVPAPVADPIVPKAADTGPGGLEKEEAVPPTTKRVIVGWTRKCPSCPWEPVYKEVPIGPAPLPSEAEIAHWEKTKEAPPKPPAHTHAETGNQVCPYCGGTCWMLRMAEREAAKSGKTTSEEFSKRWGSGTTRTTQRTSQRTYSGGGWYPGKLLGRKR